MMPTAYDYSFARAQHAWEMGCMYPRERPQPVCDQCGEGGELIPVGMDLLCPECWDRLRKERAPEFYPAYIAAHRGEFYLGWWFGSMSQQERGGLLLSLLEGAFRSLPKKEQLELQKDFCTGSPDFFDYLNRRLGESH